MSSRDLAFHFAEKFKYSATYDFFRSRYIQLRRKCTKQNADLKRSYLINQFSGHVTQKKFWSVSENFGVHSKSGPVLNDFDPNLVNDHFVSSVNAANSSTAMPPLPTNLAHSIFDFQSVSENDVRHAMNGITSNAVGFDDISIRFLKLVIDSFIAHLTHLVNFSFETSSFSKLWKKSLVTPIPKTPDVRSVNDLRAISILPCISKIVERIAHDQLTSYLNRNGLLNALQSGFRKGHSTTTALLKVSNDIRFSINNGMVTVLVLLDFTKAFASMRHDFLIDKLVHHFGLSYEASAWFKSYLEGRSQSVKIDGRSSEWRDIFSGVPEGSILGPLLFSLFINDISDGILHCKYHLYADDCQVYHSFPVSDMERGLRELNHDLSIINNWSNMNGLLLNANKTQVMVCGKPRQVQPVKEALFERNLDLYLGTERLLPSDKVKNLGLYFDEALTGIHQVNHILKQVYCRLRQLFHFNHLLPVDVKKRLVQSLVFPYFDYCDLIFYEMGGGLEAKLEVAQNNCVRFIYGLRRNISISPYRLRLGFLKPRLRRKMRMLVFLYKLFGSETPAYLRNILEFFESGHNTRYRFCNLRIPVCHSSYFRASFHLAASKVWNSLDPPLRRSETVMQFKSRLMDLLLQPGG
jgi:Reverse transcriptase (RNA-dependent DNA polymerase)